MASLAHNIAIWAFGNDARIEQVEEWRDAALISIVNGQGKEVVQTTANQLTVTFASGLSIQDWFSTLTEALAILQSGQFPPKRKQVYFPCPCENNQ